ncbi:unnamed protein product [Sphagnum balticum]
MLARPKNAGGREDLTFAKVEVCARWLKDAASSRGDNITAPLLKVGAEAIAWLHKVVLVVWQAGRALVAWKRALVVPLYKGKGARQATNNYHPISLLSIPARFTSCH